MGGATKSKPKQQNSKVYRGNFTKEVSFDLKNIDYKHPAYQALGAWYKDSFHLYPDDFWDLQRCGYLSFVWKFELNFFDDRFVLLLFHGSREGRSVLFIVFFLYFRFCSFVFLQLFFFSLQNLVGSFGLPSRFLWPLVLIFSERRA